MHGWGFGTSRGVRRVIVVHDPEEPTRQANHTRVPGKVTGRESGCSTGCLSVGAARGRGSGWYAGIASMHPAWRRLIANRHGDY